MIHKNIGGIDHIALQVPNLEAGKQFFEDILGFKVVREIKFEDYKIVMLKAGKIEIEMWQRKEDETQVRENGNSGVHHLAIQVKDMDAVMAHMKEVGVDILTEIYEPTRGIREAIVLGPGGARVQFVEHNIPLLIWRSITGDFKEN
jgi:catechol 2,3-dioxygenase-like lactoylglutathione lyase family enzyme